MSRKMEGTVKEILGTCQVLQSCVVCSFFLLEQESDLILKQLF